MCALVTLSDNLWAEIGGQDTDWINLRDRKVKSDERKGCLEIKNNMSEFLETQWQWGRTNVQPQFWQKVP